MDSSTTTPDTLNLTFVIDGSLVSNNFEEGISKNAKINDLKELLKAKRPGLFGDVADTNLLRLWKVNIPVRKGHPVISVLEGNMEDKHKEEMVAGPISDYFDEVTENNIHVIVKRPEASGATQKRDREYDEFNEVITIQESSAKRRRSMENWQWHFLPNGERVSLPQFIIDMLKASKFRPKPRSDFHPLLNVKAGDQIVSLDLGQNPKFFAEGYQGQKLFVTELMMELWELFASDSPKSIVKCLSGPMGVGKSYTAWFLAAKAYAHGWPVLYISDAKVLNDSKTEEDASEEICQRFLAINCDILTTEELKELVSSQDTSKSFVVSCASRILKNLLQQKDQKTLLIVDEHGSMFPDDDKPAPIRLHVLGPLSSPNSWQPHMAGARVVFTGTARFEKYLLGDGLYYIVFVGPLSEPAFSMLLEAVMLRFHPDVRDRINTSIGVKDEIVRITNRVPRELVNLVEDIGMDSLLLKDIKDRLNRYEARRQRELYNVAEARYNKLSTLSAEGTRLALAEIFLPSRRRPTANFDSGFLDYGLVYRTKIGPSVLDFPISPAAHYALLDLYKQCPLPEIYRNGLAKNNLEGPEFKDGVFQQFIRVSSIMLNTTNLAGGEPSVMNLNISRYEAMQDPPKILGPEGEQVLIHAKRWWERFDFILGYKFIQVSISDFAKHNVESAKFDRAFDRDDTGKNQIEKYLDAAYGGTHEATLLELQVDGKVVKSFVVEKDGLPCLDFEMIYIR
ncbi:hypothetical protein BGZ76_004388, partial [Entomortierella beljakovae]